MFWTKKSLGRRGHSLLMVSFFWIICVLLVFDKFGYEINQFNAKIRVFFKHGTIEVRSFDAEGLPYSRSAKYSNGFISPFYVVHYGLVYSEVYKDTAVTSGVHWNFDGTIKVWNVPPKEVKREFFINSADWVAKNVTLLDDNYHLFYNVDWNYKGYPNGGLRAPWYSGLTDAYAMILMLRAYDVNKNDKYLEVAKKLYQSVLTPYEQGGSLTELDGYPWVEEYVDSRVTDRDKFPYVLNGMIYATYGIISYENFFQVHDGYSEKLLESIMHNLEKFDKNGWSFYDLVGNASNMKYHRVHVSLLEEMNELFDGTDNLGVLDQLYEKWRSTSIDPGYYWLLNANKTFAFYHFVTFLVVSILFFPLVVFLIYKVVVWN